MNGNIEIRVLFLVRRTLIIRRVALRYLWRKINSFSKEEFTFSLFPLRDSASTLILGLFLIEASVNLISLVIYSYPVTTTLALNLSTALILWMSRVIIFIFKPSSLSILLPQNSPWYLAPFLGLIELVRITVRPITLCFRLLANIRAGHILLALICKIPYFAWVLGSLFCLLELIVAVVQAFVFLILVTVYVEEGLHH